MLKRQIAELQNYREAMAQVHEIARAGRKGDAARLAAVAAVAEAAALVAARTTKSEQIDSICFLSRYSG